MKNKTTFSRKVSTDINYLKICLILLSVLACFNALRFFLLPNHTNNGTFEVSNAGYEKPIVNIPVYSINSPPVGKDLVIKARETQLDKFNSSGIFNVHADSTVFTEVKDTLPWFDPADESISSKSLFNQGLVFGLLNPLMLVTPQIQAPSVKNSSFGDVNKLFQLKDIFFDSKQRIGSATVTISDIIVRNSSSSNQIKFYMASFNAFDLGFSFIQPDLNNTSNLEYSYGAEVPKQLFYHFSASACSPQEFGKEDANQCNQIFPNSGSYELKVKSVPAVASFKLWKKKPNSDSDPDMNFVINFNNSF